MYNFLGSTILGFSVGVLLGVSIGGGIGLQEWMPVGLAPEGVTGVSLGGYNDVRGRVEVEVIFNKRWGSGVN